MGKYICKICGKEFDRVGNGVYCAGPHYRPCPMCGKPVAFQRPSEPYRCCSKQCTDKMAARSKMAYPMRPCQECGKMFVPAQASQKFCKGPHITLCEVCGKEISYTCAPTVKPRHCSQECVNIAHERTVLERYDVHNVSELQEVRDKISAANSSEEVRQKREATCWRVHGAANVSQNPEIRKRLSAVMKTSKYLDGRAATCKRIYGDECPMRTEPVKEKRKQTYRMKYNRDGCPFTERHYASVMTDPSKAADYLQFKEDPQTYIDTHFAEKPTINQLRIALGTTDTPIYDVLVAHDCQDAIYHSISNMEYELTTFLQELLPEAQIKHNDRTAIKPQELDIYLPEHNFAIECNPTSTHNSSFQNEWNDHIKHYCYHQDKSMKAQGAGIFLFHVFGYEWVAHPDIIKSMIANILGQSQRRIGARDTHVCLISANECKEFLDHNHRQGNSMSKIYLGLKTNKEDELVSVMTFNHPRNTMGKTSQSSEDSWELARFCNLLNCNVIGGASKLFKYFVDKYHPKEIISFSDVAHTRGGLYEVLGFEKMYMTPPSYVWATLDDRKYYHRVTCQKQNLRKLFNDDSIDIENQTEREIMEAHKFARVYDSGVIKWKWTQSL